MFRKSTGICALAALAAAAPVAAQGSAKTVWAACYMEASGGVGTHIARLVFEPFSVSNESGSVSAYRLATVFDEQVGVDSVIAGYEAIFGSYTNECSFYPTQAEAQARFERLRNSKGYSIIKTIAWTPPGSFTGVGGAAGKAQVTGSGSSNLPYEGKADVVAATPTVQAGWDQAVRDQARRDAAARAKSIADTARADAKNQAQMAKFFAEMKKRGSAQ
jgi:hypothetical protein